MSTPSIDSGYYPGVFGVTGNGLSDDTAALQAMINAITGSANPVTATRNAIVPMSLPPGQYLISSDLLIESVEGFHLQCSSPGLGQVTFMCTGTGFTQAALVINGSADGIFEGFAIRGNGTEQVPAAIRLDCNPVRALRTTSANRFRDIRILGLEFVTGIDLTGTASWQLDGTIFDNIVITGLQTPGAWRNTGNWLYGVALGNGTFANNYDHVAMGVSVALCYYGWYCNASSFQLNGSQPAGNFCDFWILPGAQCSIKNIQSQQQGTFLIGSGFSPLPVSFEDINTLTTVPNAGFTWASVAGGIWKFDGVIAIVISGVTYEAPLIKVNGAGANHPGNVSLRLVALNGTKLTCIVPTATMANIDVENYMNYNPATGTYAAKVTGDMFSAYTASAWVNLA